MKKIENRKINISYVIPTLDRGGAERFFVDLIKNLDRDIFEPKLLLYKRGGAWLKELKDMDVKVYILRKRFIVDPFNFLRIVKALKKQKPDIVHTQLGGDIYGVLAAKVIGVKAIISTEVNINSKESKIYNLIKKISSKFNTSIIAVSEAVKEDAISRYRHKTEKVEVIYNGIEVNNFPANELPSEEDRKNDNGGAGRAFTFGTLGRLEEQKGQKYLLEAMTDKRLKDSKLLIAGDGSLKHELQAQIMKLGLAHQAELIGLVKASEFFRDIDVFVFPSLWEGMGIVLVEAALSYRPVIFSDIAGANEVLSQDNAWPAPVKDVAKLSELMVFLKDNYNSQLIKDKVEKARRDMLNRFDISDITKKHQELYLRKLKLVSKYENIASK